MFVHVATPGLLRHLAEDICKGFTTLLCEHSLPVIGRSSGTRKDNTKSSKLDVSPKGKMVNPRLAPVQCLEDLRAAIFNLPNLRGDSIVESGTRAPGRRNPRDVVIWMALVKCGRNPETVLNEKAVESIREGVVCGKNFTAHMTWNGILQVHVQVSQDYNIIAVTEPIHFLLEIAPPLLTGWAGRHRPMDRNKQDPQTASAIPNKDLKSSRGLEYSTSRCAGSKSKAVLPIHAKGLSRESQFNSEVTLLVATCTQPHMCGGDKHGIRWCSGLLKGNDVCTTILKLLPKEGSLTQEMGILRCLVLVSRQVPFKSLRIEGEGAKAAVPKNACP